MGICKCNRGNEVFLEPASSAEKHLAKTSRNQAVRVKRSIAYASGQGSTKRLRLVLTLYDSLELSLL